MNRKITFFWASIAGAEPEPVELVTIDGRKAVYTRERDGPFFLDDPNSPVRLATQFPNSPIGHHSIIWGWAEEKTDAPSSKGSRAGGTPTMRPKKRRVLRPR